MSIRCLKLCSLLVAPFTGAWIEILKLLPFSIDVIVAPFTGAWIEIEPLRYDKDGNVSLPSRERGLKCLGVRGRLSRPGRSLHGSVD